MRCCTSTFAVCMLALLSAAGCEKSAPESAPIEASKTPPSAPPPKPTVPTATASGNEANDEAFRAFAQLINEASEAVLMAARGHKPDARWGLEPLHGTKVKRLTDARRSFTTAQMEAVSQKHGYLRSSLVVLPDNRVRWIGLAHRQGATVSAKDRFDTASPVLAAAAESLVTRLSGADCTLELLSKSEASSVPGLEKEYSNLRPRLDEVCKSMRGKTDGWTPRFGDFVVILDLSGEVVMIGSRLRVIDGKLVLGSPRVH